MTEENPEQNLKLRIVERDQEHFIMEFNGNFEIDGSYDFSLQNKETFKIKSKNSDKIELIFKDSQILVGQKVKLKKPILICEKQKNQSEIKIHKILQDKFVFNKRPYQIFEDTNRKRI